MGAECSACLNGSNSNKPVSSEKKDTQCKISLLISLELEAEMSKQNIESERYDSETRKPVLGSENDDDNILAPKSKSKISDSSPAMS